METAHRSLPAHQRRARLNAAALCEQLGLADEAAALYEECLRLFPDLPEVRDRLLAFALRLNDGALKLRLLDFA